MEARMQFVKDAIKGYEPVLVMMLARFVVYALAAWGGVSFEPELAEEIVVTLFGVAGVDLASSVRARSKVTPDQKTADLPPSRKG